MEPILKRTPLYSLHLEAGARMVGFAGYEMPVQYPAGIKAEHEHTRTSAGLFDISHMGQVRVDGKESGYALENLVPGDIQSLGIHRQRYTVLTNPEGGVIDDLMVTRMPDHFFLVVNAARKEYDYAYLRDSLKHSGNVQQLEDRALLALQGPQAATVLGQYSADIMNLPFLSAGLFNLGGIDCLVHRCGYTGEDGYEISLPAVQAELFARKLLQDNRVKLIGLGARDSLRLEAGLCLYGHDLDETTTPVEAGLAWIIAKRYLGAGAATAQFPGATRILREVAEGPRRTRLGFRPEGRIPVREGTTIFDSEGLKVGIITSGGYGQTAGGPIAMGYVTTSSSRGSYYNVEIRNQMHRVIKTDLPFVKHRYYKKT